MRRFLALLLLAPGLAWGQPRRVVSLNLCTDQLLLALAEPGSVAAVTGLSQDCALSVACAAAAGHRAIRGTAEEVVALHPDLVLGGRFTARPALDAARRLGIPVLELDPADSLDAIRAQVTAVAAALGRNAEGAEVVAAFDRRLLAIPAPPPEPRKVAAIYQANGFTVGAHSLAGDVLRRAGLDNFAVTRGLDRYGVLPMEALVWGHPDILVTDGPAAHPSQATALLRHPLLAEAFAGRRVAVPSRLWLCGLPETLDAVALLAAEARR